MGDRRNPNMAVEPVLCGAPSSREARRVERCEGQPHPTCSGESHRQHGQVGRPGKRPEGLARLATPLCDVPLQPTLRVLEDRVAVVPIDHHVAADVSEIRSQAPKHRNHLRSDLVTVLDDEHLCGCAG